MSWMPGDLQAPWPGVLLPRFGCGFVLRRCPVWAGIAAAWLGPAGHGASTMHGCENTDTDPSGVFTSCFCNTSRSWECARTHSCAVGAGCRHCFRCCVCLASLPPLHGRRLQVPLMSPDPSSGVPGAVRPGRQPSRPSGEPALGERVQEVNGGRG